MHCSERFTKIQRRKLSVGKISCFLQCHPCSKHYCQPRGHYSFPASSRYCTKNSTWKYIILCSNPENFFSTMEAARKQMKQIAAKQRLKFASKLSTKAMNVFSISQVSQFLVYREKNRFEGPSKLHKYDYYKTAYFNMEKAIEPFPISAVKQFYTENPSVGN